MSEPINQMMLGEQIGRLANAVDHLTKSVDALQTRITVIEAAAQLERNQAAFIKGGAKVLWFLLGAAIVAGWQWLLTTLKP